MKFYKNLGISDPEYGQIKDQIIKVGLSRTLLWSDVANNKITLNLKWCSTILLTKRWYFKKRRPLDDLFEEEHKMEWFSGSYF